MLVLKRLEAIPVVGQLDEARYFSHAEGLIFPSVTGKPSSDATLSKLTREQGIQAVLH